LVPLDVLYLAQAHAGLGQFADARCCIGEAMKAEESVKDRLWEADILRTAGEIALNSPDPDPVKAQAYFERALAVARQQKAKSWELRAAMSLARLWRDQGKVQQARELLAPVYGWVRHARSEGSEGAAARVGGVRPTQVHSSGPRAYSMNRVQY
jgi:predicted ATPase